MSLLSIHIIFRQKNNTEKKTDEKNIQLLIISSRLVFDLKQRVLVWYTCRYKTEIPEVNSLSSVY